MGSPAVRHHPWTPAPAGGRRPLPAAVPAAGLVAAVLVVSAASLLLGSNHLGVGAVLAALADPARDPGAVVWGSRVPRTVLGLLVGACLGAAGAVMQGQTRNALADPGLFGVSAGAGLAVVLGVHVADLRSPAAMLWLALVGALLATLAVFGVAALGRGLAGQVPLAVAGAAVSALLGALTSFLVLGDDETLAAYRIWVVGTLSGRTLDGVTPALVVALLGAVLALANVRALDGLALGADLARGLGEGLVRARLVGLGAITLLAAAAVATTGPIGFVGLTAPHLARRVVGSGHARLLPASACLGAVVLLGCDVLGRLVGGTSEVAVGVLLSVVGGCVFVAVVRRGRTDAL